ncbi:endonuclease/exonuclease/phosphatase family protein [Sphingobacterium sp. SRCM116780]|uniref:endonuclease/exonuclease/phosphatase family protein n=1 Tax=Sphingobacterium sp. SRCM116780 TaxID=2907623 RepID=UPI001F201546|nr:endonuclease/exonuclease/phosphatase family protein [Sphingobacterium sp. SRCM116780]UIR55400.1 endonuclease/exonuclease/phosphatase family protein [Sphingobacterium sp. SRCM116780]
MKKYILSYFILSMLCCSSLILSAQKLKILTYNIHHANPPSEDVRVINLDTIAAIIKKSNADLIGLQEIDIDLSRSQNIDQAKKLAELTGMHYFFSKGINLDAGEYGTVILSKYPIVKTERFELPSPIVSEKRSLAIIHIQVNGKTIKFANTHLDLKEENRLAQSSFILDKFKDDKDLVILVGDLNAKPESQVIQNLDSIFTRSQIKNGFTIPEMNPNREIDFIMLNKANQFKFRKHHVLEETYASDHRPVYVEIYKK